MAHASPANTASDMIQSQLVANLASMANHGHHTQKPVCQNCETSTTPLWRRDEAGAVLCNACGLFLKLHGRPRPISLKTDVIKSRNRVKTSRTDMNKQKAYAKASPIPCAPSAAESYRLEALGALNTEPAS